MTMKDSKEREYKNQTKKKKKKKRSKKEKKRKEWFHFEWKEKGRKLDFLLQSTKRWFGINGEKNLFLKTSKIKP